MSWIRLHALGGVVLAALASTGSAQTISGSWLGLGSGSFEDASSWSSNPTIPNRGSAQFLDANGGLIDFRLTPPPTILTDILFNTATQTKLNPTLLQLTSGLIDNRHAVSDSIFGTAVLSPSAHGLIGGAGLIKNGAGAVYLDGISSFSGSVVVNGGTLQFSNDAAFGLASNMVLLNNGAIQAVQSGTATEVYRSVALQGANYLSGSATFENAIVGSGSLMLIGDAITFNGANNYTGATYVRGGGTAGLTIAGNSSIASSSQLDIVGRVVLANAGTVNTNRLNDSGTITIHSGTLELDGNINNTISETVGATKLTGGGNVLQISTGTRAATLGLASLTRSGHATLNVQAANLFGVAAPGANLIISNLNSLLVGGSGLANTTRLKILPFAIEGSDSSNLRLLTSAVGAPAVRPLTVNEYEGIISNAAADVNVRLTADTSIGTPTSANALLINSNTLSGAGTLTVTSGLIAGHGTINCPVDFGSAEGIIFATRMNGPISGSGGVTYDQLNWTNPASISAASSYSGPTTLNGGTFIISGDVLPNVPGPLGNDAASVPITLSSGVQPAVLNSPTAVNFGRDIVVDYDPRSKYTTAPYLLGAFKTTGNITLGGALRVSGGFTSTGTISGPGSIVDITGQSSISLSGNNSYTGGTLLRNGTITLGSNTALGTGTLTLNGIGTLLTSDLQPKFLTNSLFFDPANTGATLTFAAKAGAIVFTTGTADLGTGTAHINVLNASDQIVGLVANGSLVKDGTGTLRMGQLGLNSLNVNGGIVSLTNALVPSRIGALSMTAGTKLDLGNTGLIVTYGDATTPADAIRNLIATEQIYSSLSSTGVTTVGYVDNAMLGSQFFAGSAVSLHSVLIEKTYFGDTNLDGKVDIVDLGNLAGNWHQSAVWAGGDFNYDGTVDIVDLGALAGNWQAGGTGSMTFQDALLEVGFGGTSVPEPGTLAASVLSFSLLKRKRRET